MRCVVLSWLFCVFLCAPTRADDVLVFAAASLAGPLDAVAQAFEADTGHRIILSYGASSTLARQVEAGAPADMVVLANEAWMDHLEDHRALRDGTRQTLLANRLVLIANAATGEEPLALETLSAAIGQDRLALALTEAVPAGIYARAALENLNQWDAINSQVVEADNVRAAMQLVALGAAGYGIVYATDAVLEPRVRVLAEIPNTLHPPIRYPFAITRTGNAAAEEFAQTLSSPSARDAFAASGFGVVTP